MYVIGVRSKDADNWAATSGGLYLFNDQSSGSGGSWYSTLGNTYKVYGAGRYWIPLPFGVSAVTWPTSQATYGGRTYYVGGFTYNLLLDEHHRLLKQGIRGPEAAPGVAGAPGSTKIAYLSWYDELTGERSPLSMGTAIGDATPRTWTLPTRPPDEVFQADGTMTNNADTHIHADTPAARSFYFRPGDRIGFPDAAATTSYLMVNQIGLEGAITTDGTGDTPVAASTVVGLPISRCSHIELWLSVGGGLPRLVMRAAIGTVTVVESIASGDLGESNTDSFERFPRCTMNVIWNDRQIMSGNPDEPDVVYMSDLYYPERYGGLNFRTKTGQPVTGLLALRDYCLVFTRTQTFMLTGYSEADFQLSMVEQSLGSVGHQCNRVVHGAAYILTEKGPYMFNGSWHPLSPENDFTVPAVATSQWIRGVVDPSWNTFSIISPDIEVYDRYDSFALPGDPFVSVFKNILVFDYTTVQPETGGAMQPARLSIDAQDVVSRTGFSAGYSETICYNHYLANKWGSGFVYTLSYDGSSASSFDVYPHQRIGDINAVPGLASTYDKGFWVKTGWASYGAPGGSFIEGKVFTDCWIDAPCAEGGTVYLGFGSDPIGTGSLAITLPASSPGVGVVRPAWSQWVRLEGGSGKGMHLILYCPNLITGGSFRGFGGKWR